MGGTWRSARGCHGNTAIFPPDQGQQINPIDWHVTCQLDLFNSFHRDIKLGPFALSILHFCLQPLCLSIRYLLLLLLICIRSADAWGWFLRFFLFLLLFRY